MNENKKKKIICRKRRISHSRQYRLERWAQDAGGGGRGDHSRFGELATRIMNTSWVHVFFSPSSVVSLKSLNYSKESYIREHTFGLLTFFHVCANSRFREGVTNLDPVLIGHGAVRALDVLCTSK